MVNIRKKFFAVDGNSRNDSNIFASFEFMKMCLSIGTI